MTPFQQFQQHVARWNGCQQCPLGTQRDRIVLARGTVPCDVLLIGEAPGDSEDVLGQPFCGPAGHLLDRIIHESITRCEITHGLPQPPTYALTNLVACFPRHAKRAGTNEPEKAEIQACSTRLVEFVRICCPRLIVLVGKLAVANVHGASQFSIKRDMQPEWIPEGRILEFCEISHPAWIKRLPVVQQGFEIQKSCVILSNALERLL